MNLYSNPLIYGKDQTENIVNVSFREEDNEFWIFKEKQGKLTTEIEPYSQWLLSNRMRAETESYKRLWTPLKGDVHYKWLRQFDDRQDFQYSRSKAKRKGFDCFTIWNAVESYLVQQGITYFKGLQLEDVSLFSFDLETTGTVLDYSSKILLISTLYRCNGEYKKRLFKYDDYESEADMIIDFCDYVRKLNPTLLMGYNIMGFDLPYMRYVADRYGVGLCLGRDDSDLQFDYYNSKFRKDGSQEIEYVNATCFGREIIDVMFLVIAFDVVRKELSNYKMKTVVEELGLEKSDRQHYDAALISKNYQKPEEWKKICQYAEDDAEDPVKLFDKTAPPFFFFNQSVPRTFQRMTNGCTNTGGQLNAIILRAYLQNGESVAKTSQIYPFQGAISFGNPGVYHNCFKIDVKSEYPSIILRDELYNKEKDPNAYFLKMVEYFTYQRFENKRLFKETNNQYYYHMEQTQKIGINSSYGLTSTHGLNYNDGDIAEHITRSGREIVEKAHIWATGYSLKRIVDKISNEGKETEKKHYKWVLDKKVQEGKGFQSVNADTDSIMFCKKEQNEYSEKEHDSLLEEVNDQFHEKIKWDSDGLFQTVIVTKAKNYVLDNRQIEGGKVKFKGSAFKSSKTEPALKEMMNVIAQEILDNGYNMNRIVEIYEDTINEVVDIQDITRWCSKKTITKKVLENDRTNEAKVRHVIETMDEEFQQGDKLLVYTAIDGMKQKVSKGVPQFYKKTKEPILEPNTVYKHVDQWDENNQYIKHYLKRCYDTISILKNVLDMKRIVKYHNKGSKKKLEKLLGIEDCDFY